MKQQRITMYGSDDDPEPEYGKQEHNPTDKPDDQEEEDDDDDEPADGGIDGSDLPGMDKLRDAID